MQSLWNDADAQQYVGELEQRVYTSRLLGQDKTLVVHRGDKPSVATQEAILVGDVVVCQYLRRHGTPVAPADATDPAPVGLPQLLERASPEERCRPQLEQESSGAVSEGAPPRRSGES